MACRLIGFLWHKWLRLWNLSDKILIEQREYKTHFVGGLDVGRNREIMCGLKKEYINLSTKHEMWHGLNVKKVYNCWIYLYCKHVKDWNLTRKFRVWSNLYANLLKLVSRVSGGIFGWNLCNWLGSRIMN